MEEFPHAEAQRTQREEGRKIGIRKEELGIELHASLTAGGLRFIPNSYFF